VDFLRKKCEAMMDFGKNRTDGQGLSMDTVYTEGSIAVAPPSFQERFFSVAGVSGTVVSFYSTNHVREAP